MKIGKCSFREADELVSALQNDVDGIISGLRGKEIKEEKFFKVPEGFCLSPSDWYWSIEREECKIEKVELIGNTLVFYNNGEIKITVDYSNAVDLYNSIW